VLNWLEKKYLRVQSLLESREKEREGANQATEKQSLAEGFNMGGAENVRKEGAEGGEVENAKVRLIRRARHGAEIIRAVQSVLAKKPTKPCPSSFAQPS
jgi:hypothetical protein